MIKFQNGYFIETVKKHEDKSGHKHYAQLYTSHFQDHPMMNKHSREMKRSLNHYTTIFIQYKEGFNFAIGKHSSEIKDVHMTIPN